ncbi:MAG: hypothetical protein OHK0029_18710 [Armatimonadaceae bacterium]
MQWHWGWRFAMPCWEQGANCGNEPGSVNFHPDLKQAPLAIVYRNDAGGIFRPPLKETDSTNHAAN